MDENVARYVSVALKEGEISQASDIVLTGVHWFFDLNSGKMEGSCLQVSLL